MSRRLGVGGEGNREVEAKEVVVKEWEWFGLVGGTPVSHSKITVTISLSGVLPIKAYRSQSVCYRDHQTLFQFSDHC